MTALDQSAFLQALGWAVLNSLWQMSLLWILFNIIVSLSGSLKPAQKSTLAVSLLFTGFTWFVFTFFSLIISIENNNAIVTLKALPKAVNTRLNHWLDTSLPFASLIYIVLLIVPLLQFVRKSGEKWFFPPPASAETTSLSYSNWTRSPLLAAQFP